MAAATGVVLDQRREDRRARRGGQRAAEAAVPRSRAGGRRRRRRLARRFTGIKIGLGHLPHERGAVRAAGLHLPAGHRRAGPSRLRHRHRPDARLPRARLSRCAHARLVARAGRRDADPLDARCHAGAAGQACREPVRAARGAASARRAQLGRRREKEAFADLVIDTVDAHAPNFKASGDRAPGPLAARPRAALRPGRRRHLPRRSCRSISCSRRAPSSATPTTACRSAGLYLCGSGAHPGGGVTGVPGHNAAREIIRDFKGWRRRGPFVCRATSRRSPARGSSPCRGSAPVPRPSSCRCAPS